jgi:hypothetical protein
MRFLILALLCLPAFAQETCKYCPTDLSAQFPDVAPEAPHKTFSKPFLIVHGFAAGATVFDIEMTQHGLKQGHCVEGGFDGVDRHPSRKEMYLTDMATWGADTAFDAIFSYALSKGSHRQRKYLFFMPYMFAGPQTALHLKGGIEWASCF